MKQLDLVKKAFARGSHGPEVFSTSARRLFFGPAEGQGVWAHVAIDLFADHVLITHWEEIPESVLIASVQVVLTEVSWVKVICVGVLNRCGVRGPGRADPIRIIFGVLRPEIVCQEWGFAFIVKFGQRQPGIFLDHAPLRLWLTQHAQQKTVLNTFCFTGLLSLACCQAQAKSVMNIDISAPALDWARQNHALPRVHFSQAQFKKVDCEQYLAWCIRKKVTFDIVILDPPSFSRSHEGVFSVQKDLPRLIQQASSLVNQEGFLIVSTNCDELTWSKFEDFFSGLVGFALVQRLEPGFLKPLGSQKSKGLVKGVILQKVLG